MSGAAPFGELPRGYYGAILADPATHFETWSAKGMQRSAENHYSTMSDDELLALPVAELAAKDSVLFLWMTWPKLKLALALIEAWGFRYRTCAFAWTKAHAGQLEMFEEAIPPLMGNGYWTRANTEVCLLGTRGKPKRLDASVRQAIIEPRRQHSRKPDCVHTRIEALVAGPYIELFARRRRRRWDVWGNEPDCFPAEYDPADDVERSFEDAYRAIRSRVAAGGPGWNPK